ncbi:PLP-dependent aminotransferase family protein [candidate division WOR-3 bacterium]|nr:PLP-dependent aminotransferase family protein [candidate division WOR-3 bacterium]
MSPILTKGGPVSLQYDLLYSENAKAFKKSAIRELLKLTAKPNIISFAGGLPHHDTFPIPHIKEIVTGILEKEGKKILQYSTTEGDQGLKEELCKWLAKDGVQTTPDKMLIVSASQQALDLIARIFLNPGDTCIVGLPTYLGFIQSAAAVRGTMIGIPLDDDGMKTDFVEETIKKLINEGKKPKFIYVIPDFQNPAGVTMSLERRKKLLEIAEEFEMIIIEDSPYRKLRYSGKALPSIFELDNGRGYVVTLYTFSKIFLPGFRLGWIIGPKHVIEKMVLAKQGMDLCTSLFTQAISREYIRADLLDERIEKNIVLYSKKRKKMLEALEKYMPKMEGLKWTKPEGGLFLWLSLPQNINTDRMFYKAVEENVAYVIGSAFYCDGGGQNTMRLNFSYPSEEEIDIGIQRLAKVIEKEKETIDKGLNNIFPQSP